MNIIKRTLNKFILRKKSKMEQEILEQPDIIFELTKKYINKDYSINITLPEDVKSVALIASGSSYYAGEIASNFIRNSVHINAQTFYASEVSLADNFDIKEDTLYIFVSQSGETGDTNLALSKIKQKTDKILAITNAKNSQIYNNAVYKMLSYAGAEKAISSTKSMSAQIFCLFLCAVKLMQVRNIPSMNYIEELINVPEYIKKSINSREQIKKAANTIINYENVLILGTGLLYHVAREGALKLKETAYINANAYPTGEFLHGHIAVLNKKNVVIALVNNQNIHFTIDVLMKINNNYKSDILIISAMPVNENDKNDIINVDTKSNIDFLFATLVIMQLLSLESAAMLDRNADNPQGLTKVVK